MSGIPNAAADRNTHRNVFRELVKTFIDYDGSVFNIVESQVDVTDESSVLAFVRKVRNDPACTSLLSLLNSGSLTAIKIFDALRQPEEPTKQDIIFPQSVPNLPKPAVPISVPTAPAPALALASAPTSASAPAPAPAPASAPASAPELIPSISLLPSPVSKQAPASAPDPLSVPAHTRPSVMVTDQSPAPTTFNNEHRGSVNTVQNGGNDIARPRSPDNVDLPSSGDLSKKRRKLTHVSCDSFSSLSVDELINLGEQMISSSRSEHEKVLATEMLRAAIQRSQGEQIETTTKLQLGYILHDGMDGIQQDLPRAASLYQNVLDDEWNCSAARNLARILMDGANGTGAADFAKAARLFNDVVKNGDSNSVKGLAMSDLGLLYMFGANGVTPDTEKALTLWETASSSTYNTAAAMVNLGNVHCIGMGQVEKNLHKAIALYEKAIKLDNQGEAMCNLAILLQHGVPNVLEADLAEAVKLHERAIREETHLQSMIELGMLLTIGKGAIKRDCDRAATLFEMASKRSWEDGRRVRELLTCGSTLADFRYC